MAKKTLKPAVVITEAAPVTPAPRLLTIHQQGVVSSYCVNRNGQHILLGADILRRSVFGRMIVNAAGKAFGDVQRNFVERTRHEVKEEEQRDYSKNCDVIHITTQMEEALLAASKRAQETFDAVQDSAIAKIKAIMEADGFTYNPNSAIMRVQSQIRQANWYGSGIYAFKAPEKPAVVLDEISLSLYYMNAVKGFVNFINERIKDFECETDKRVRLRIAEEVEEAAAMFAADVEASVNTFTPESLKVWQDVTGFTTADFLGEHDNWPFEK